MNKSLHVISCKLVLLFLLLTTGAFSQNTQTDQLLSNPTPGACAEKTCTSTQEKAGSFTNAYTSTQCGLNYAISGVILNKRSAQPGVNQPAALNISTIPVCVNPSAGNILRAYVYWIVEGGAATGSVSLTNPLASTVSFPGVLIGNIPGGKCWGCTDTRHFRADVTAHITGNGSYSISGLPSSTGCGDTDGAVLIIIYKDPAATYQGTMVLHNGNILVNGGAQNHTLTGFTACAAGVNESAFTVTGDLQSNVGPSTPITMNGFTANVPNNFFNLDVRTNINVTPGQSTSLFGVSSASDCWSWICAGLYYQTNGCATCTGGGPLPAPGPISGPTTLCSGQNSTYSISAVSGATSYNWTVPSGWTINSGQGTTSISVTASTTSGNVCVTASNSCGTSTATCKFVTIISTPAQPGFISGPTSVCSGVSQSYSIAAVSGATSYTWTYSGGGTPSGTGTTATLIATSSGTLCVTANNSCGSSTTSCKSITVTAIPAQPGLISGPTSVCSGVSQSYSIASVPGATSYTWTYSGGGTPSGTGTTATLTPTSSGTLCVTANNSCGSSTARCISIVVTAAPAQPGAITGLSVVCPSTSGTYSISLVSGATSYSWTVPVGWTINSGQGTNSITITTGSATGNVCVTAINSCGSSSPSCLAVTTGSAPAAPGTITGSNTVCANTSTTYSIASVTGATSYTWTVPSGWTINSGQGTTSITVGAGTAAGNICVTASSPCGTSPQTCLAVSIITVPNPSTSVLGSSNVCQASTSVYSTQSVFGATSYNWTVPTGATINSGQGTTSINVTFGGTSGNVCVQSVNTCGSSTQVCLAVNVSPFSVGGIMQVNDTVCQGSNSGTLNLTGYTGSILKWQFSTDGGLTWTDIFNTTSSQNYSNLTDTTLYQAIVQSGVCSNDTSTIAEILVIPAVVGGTLLSDANYCSTVNGATLNLVGFSGSVVNWEFSTDNGLTWNIIVNNTSSLTYSNLTQTTLYRVIVSGVGGGPCPSNVSSIATITVNPASSGGIVINDTTVCSGINSGTLNLTGSTGTIVNWEMSTDSSAWFVLSNNTSSFTFNNLSTTSWFRVMVQSANCPPAYSIPAKVTVDSQSAGGNVLSSATVCSGGNGNNLNLTGFNGNILGWLSSTNGGTTWNNISNTTSVNPYLNLTTTTWYSAVVENGVCPADTSSIAIITVNAAPVGGNIVLDATVCSGSNSGTLTLSGNTGTIVNWELSNDGGFTWINLSNTSTSQTYNNLTLSTAYRAVISSGICGTTYSDTAQITVIPASQGGSITGGNLSVCANSNTGTLNLTGYVGAIQYWEFSTDNGNTWTNVTNTTDSLNYTNITTTTIYQAVVQSGACTPDTSATATIIVNPSTVGGIVQLDDTVCSGMNGATLTLTGHVGTVQNWEVSTDGGITWAVLSNNADTLGYSNITQTSMYRAKLQSGSACSQAYSSIATITVTSPSVGGFISSSNSVCADQNGDTLSLAGFNGNILYWEYSTNNGSTWTNIPSTNDSLIYSNLTTTTWYQAIVQNGVCPPANSTIAVITVSDSTVAGFLSSSVTVCAGMNNGTLLLTGFVGSVQAWETSTDGGITWSVISNTTSSQVYNNLSTTTHYRVRVKSGVCALLVSNTVVITVDAMSNAGTFSSSASVCSTGNSDTLLLTGYTGNITNYIYSGNAGSTWNDVYTVGVGAGYFYPNDTVSYNNLDSTVWYVAIVQNGVCPADTSDPVIITVSPESVGGTILINDTVCYGANNDTLLLSGYVGSIQNWETSTDGGNTWTSISNTSPSQVYNNLTITTQYRVRVKSGACPSALSVVVTIVVQPQGLVGSLSGDGVVCNELQWDTLQLLNYTGSIVMWQSSNDNGVSWNNISNTDDTLVVTGITGDTWYRVLVQSGVCSTDTTAVAKLLKFSGKNLLALDDYFWVKSGQNSVLNLTQNDSGVWNVLTMVTSATNGLAINNNDGTVTYNPTQGFIGIDSIVYSICENICESCDTALVRLDVGLFIPTGFSPDGDGINDFFVITGIENYPDHNITIYNRWGDKLFFASPYNNDWDGRASSASMKLSGEHVVDGTYFYIIQLDPNTKPINGFIELRRGN